MIIGLALKRDGELEFPEKTYVIVNVSDKEKNEIICVMKEKNSNCIQTKTFKRVGEEIKSGIDLGECLRYIPPKKIPFIGQKYENIIIQEILRKTEKGWHCLASYGSAISSFLRIIPE